MEGIAMRKFILYAIPFVLSVLLFTSCSNAQQQYERGNYQAAVSRINRLSNPGAGDFLLKAKSYIALGQAYKAKESLLLYLLTGEESRSEEDRRFAVSNFIELNSSDSLTLMLIEPKDGLEARKALYKAYSRTGDFENAKFIADMLSEDMEQSDLISLMLSYPEEPRIVLDFFVSWYENLEDSERDEYISLLSEFSSASDIPETTAKSFLSLTDVLMGNPYFTGSDMRLSIILKIKGNILEKLFDKVNARIYWTQAYRLNPADEELKNKLKYD